MDPSYTNLHFRDSEDYPNTQYYQNSSSFPNPSQDFVTQSLETSQNSANQSKGGTKWDFAEDVALMSAFCFVSKDSINGKNQKTSMIWNRVKELYDAAQAENPEKLGPRNKAQMKGRYHRLNETVSKWVAAYDEAIRQTKSGMGQKDIESVAYTLYEQGRTKFNDYVVWNEVMSKKPRWELNKNLGTRRSRSECEVGNEESGGSAKRSRTTEEGDYGENSNPDTPNSGTSTIQRPIGREAAKSKRKGKGKVSNEMAEALNAMTLTRSSELELMNKRLEFEKQREQKMEEMKIREQELEQKKEEREREKKQIELLSTLLQKPFLTHEEENLKRHLLLKFHGPM